MSPTGSKRGRGVKRRPRAKGKKPVTEVGATTPVSSDQAASNCSFCGKSQRDVRKLIHGPGVCICDECVELCQDILAPSGEEETTVSPEEWEIVRRLPPAAALRASSEGRSPREGGGAADDEGSRATNERGGLMALVPEAGALPRRGSCARPRQRAAVGAARGPISPIASAKTGSARSIISSVAVSEMRK